MKKTSLNAKVIRARARTIRLPRPIVDEVVSNFFKWCRHSGEEWAVAHMKDIKAAMIYFYANGCLPKETWVKKTTPDKFAGVWGWLQSELVTSKKNRRRVMQLLNIYTSLIAKGETKKQREKFLSSVTNLRKPVPTHYKYSLGRVAAKYNIRWRKPDDLEKLLFSAQWRQNHEARMGPEVMNMLAGPIGRLLVVDHWKIMSAVLDEYIGSQVARAADPQLDVIGEIHMSQEPGYKLRHFGAPNIWLQQCLMPLKKGLQVLLQKLPWDGTYNQQVADEHILTRLREGKTVHCFDLSDATNVFPLELQVVMMRQALSKDFAPLIDFFETVSQMPWRYNGQAITWARGQVLGLGPSFMMFAATHGMLLASLNQGQHDDKFFVIGDDVVILDDELAEAYADALVDLDLPFSPLKTLRSNRIAEFAGFVFTTDGKFQSVKWKGIVDENLLDTVRNVGPDIIPFLHPSIQGFTEWFARLPEPIGFGWNPEGLSLDQRLSNMEEFLASLLDPKLPQGELDTNKRKRAEARLSRLAETHPRETRLITHNLERDRNRYGKSSLTAAGQADAARLSTLSFFLNAPWLTHPLRDQGKILRFLEHSRDAHLGLPLAQPKKFKWKQSLPRFDSVRKNLEPYYQMWCNAQGAVDSNGSCSTDVVQKEIRQ